MNNHQPLTNNETLKQALISIFVGAVVAFFATLFQGLLDVLQGVPVEPVAGAIGASRHLLKTLV